MNKEIIILNNSGMQIFKNSEFGEIRTVLINNNPWWVLKDVCDALGLSSSHKVAARLDEDELTGIKLRSGGQSRSMYAVNESGLYAVILRSDKPNAKIFRKWITNEVLPSIRKHGMYATEELLDNPEFAAKVFTALHEERQKRLAVERKNELLEEKNEVLEFKIEQDKPLVNFAEAVSASNESIPVGDFAKLLNQNGIDIGRNRMFEYFRDNGYLIKSGASKNLPTQKYMDSGLFEIHESGYYNSYNEWQITLTTYITGKGQKYFYDKFFVSMSA